MTTRVYIDYSDGRYNLHAHPEFGLPVDLPFYQWRLYKLHRWIDGKIYNWLVKLDKQARHKVHYAR